MCIRDSYYTDDEDVVLIQENLHYVIPIVFGIMFGNLLSRYISNFKLIVVPEILNNLWIKVAVPICGILYFLDYISFSQFFVGISIAYLLPMIGLFIYLWWLGEMPKKLNTSLFTGSLIKKIQVYGAYTLLGSLGTIIATRIDILMVGELLNMDNVGIYSIALFIASVIGIPFRSMMNITSPVISDLMAKHDLNSVHRLYQKTSINLLVIGILLLIGIWASIDLLFDIIPNGEVYKPGKYVVLVLGLATLVDMVTSINTNIIVYSHLYRFNFYFSLILAVLNIGLNLLFIQAYGLIGTAYATLTSMIVFNLIKYLFVLIKFNMQPFTFSMLWVLLVGIIAYVSTYFLPKTGNPFLDIIINSITISLIYIPAILYFNLSEDLTKLKQQGIEKLRNFW